MNKQPKKIAYTHKVIRKFDYNSRHYQWGEWLTQQEYYHLPMEFRQNVQEFTSPQFKS